MKTFLKKLAWHLQESMTKHFKLWTAGIVVLVIALIVGILGYEADIGTPSAAQEVVDLEQNIRKYYQSKPDFWGLSTASVIAQKIAPQAMLRQDMLRGFWGNLVLVGKGENGDVLMPGARGFDIIYKPLKEQQCIALASFKFTEKFWLGIAGVTLGNGKETRYFTWNEQENILPITKKKAKKICRSDNFIIWHFE